MTAPAKPLEQRLLEQATEAALTQHDVSDVTFPHYNSGVWSLDIQLKDGDTIRLSAARV